MDTSTKILLTGFEPFGGMETNPSEQVVRLLAQEAIPGVQLTTMVLPVEYRRAMDIIREQAGVFDYIIMLGVARTRKEISIERVAINLMDASSSDNAGYIPSEEPIAPNGPTAYFSPLPVKQIADAICSSGLYAKVSNTAGTYVCNAVYFAALHEIDSHNLLTKAVFFHLPNNPIMDQQKLQEIVHNLIQLQKRI